LKDAAKFKKHVRISLFIFIALFAILMIYLGYAVINYGEKWFATPYNSRLQNAASTVKAGTITDVNGVKLAWTDGSDRKYSDDKETRLAVAHAVGDNKGKSMGAETLFAKHLYGFDKDIVDRVGDVLHGSDKVGSDITLTIDSKLSKYIYEKMDGRRGSVVVMNYKTGAIKAMVNLPSFDPYKLSDKDIEDTSLVNRATMGLYPPGSTMKVMTAAAALSEGLDFEYDCKGKVVIAGQTISCSDGAHGHMDLKKALAESCNVYFAELTLKLGAAKMASTASQFGYNEDFNFNDVALSTSKYETSDNEGDLAWSGIGQYNDLITPLQNAMIAGAVANGGVMMEPKLLERAVSGKSVTYKMAPTEYRQIMSSSIASTLTEYMRGVVTGGTGTAANISGVKVCGKTGTAEYMEDGEKKSHAWFIGFIDDEDTPYCISVILEGAGSGGRNAAPLAGAVFKKILED